MRLLVSAVAVLLVTAPAHAYRPFESTDADVAAAGELETELGYLTIERNDDDNTYVVPKLVLNYGVTRDLEVIGEFDVEIPPAGGAQIVDAAVLLKGMLRRGLLQGETGLSIAFEAGLLVPGDYGERAGFEGFGIVSGAVGSVTYHLNLGGGLGRDDSEPFLVWGAIAEYPFSERMRLVGEVNGEKLDVLADERSALLGVIWESPATGDTLDAAVRWGIGSVAPDWTLTLGWTFSFPRP